MIWVIAIAFVFVIYLLRYVLNNLMNKGFDAIGNSRRQSKNMRGPEIVRLADMYPYEAARHQPNGTAYAINPMLLTPENGPYQQANPYAQANPYMYAAPVMPMGGTAPVMATIENGKTKSELQAEKDFIVKKGGWICYNCPSCGSEIEPTDKFCNVCGYKLKTEE